MNNLREAARRLLESGEVQVVIGYGEGTAGRVRPLFLRTAEETEALLFDARCTRNLAMYLYKKETAVLGKPAIVAQLHTLRAIIRLAAEKQLQEDSLIALCVAEGEEVTVCRTLSEIEAYLTTHSPVLSDSDRAQLEKLEAMTPAERWAFWKNELEQCVKCYACRQACPLCYCSRCTVEDNQPQWISVEASTLGNLEWHVMRAMHLAGRCISCGQCGEACPVGIPIHLLPMKLAETVRAEFGMVSGTNRQEGNALSTFRPEDHEHFIG